QKLAFAIRRDGRGLRVFVNRRAVACRADGGKRADEHKLFDVLAMLERGTEQTLGAALINVEVILSSPRKRHAGDVIDRINAIERRLPIRRVVDSAVSEFEARIFQVA